MNGFQLAFLLWSVASALAVVALGVFTATGGKARPRGAWAFGLFASTWGIQIILGALASTIGDAATASFAYMGFVVFTIPLPFFLFEFAASQSTRPHALGWAIARVLAAGLALGVAITFATVPGLVFQGVQETDENGIVPLWGPLHSIAVILPYLLSFAIVLWTLARAHRAAATPRVADRVATLLAGLGLFVSFAATNNLVFYVASALADGLTWTYTFFLLTTLIASILSVALGLRFWRESRAHNSTRERLVALSLLVPAAWGVLEALLTLGPLPYLNSVGLWRLTGVAVIAYGIARWRVYDLPQRASRAAAGASGVGAALATGATAYGAGLVVTSGPLIPATLGILVASAALMPSMGFARRLFGVERARERRDLQQALYGQRIDSYRAALEASLARGTLAEDQPFLAALRERFGISPDEDRLLMHLANSSVLVARETRAWDAYERLRLLGEGGGGRTWLARDRARDRLVVLKEPLERWQQDPAAREMVLREARLAAKVRHANVVAIEEVVEGKGSPVIVMEYLEGGSLRDVLRARGTLPWPEAKVLALDVLRGLEAVHSAGIVHRDIKPSNILLDGEGLAKVADFGIAVTPATSSDRTMMIDPMHSTIAGTLHYMAPEARSGGALDRRADVYACGAVLHELLYGAPPGLRSPMVVRDDLPAGVARSLALALAPDPATRYASAKAFAEDLARL
ncbi:MAG TPA: serine/threonine-protein kinase [Candidatus Thermoplasmatota archaeon]|nr:serine/threonine-protein kinase [Candidatus Thermoplasmatota archaeon]